MGVKNRAPAFEDYLRTVDLGWPDDRPMTDLDLDQALVDLDTEQVDLDVGQVEGILEVLDAMVPQPMRAPAPVAPPCTPSRFSPIQAGAWQATAEDKAWAWIIVMATVSAASVSIALAIVFLIQRLAG